MRPGTEYRWRDKDGREHTLLPDAGWSYNPGRQPFGPPPPVSGPESLQRHSPAANQKTWEWFGRPKTLPARPLPDSPAPSPGREVEHVLKLLGGDAAAGKLFHRLDTPVGEVVLTEDFVHHFAEREGRAKRANRILTTLNSPDEVWVQARHQNGRILYSRVFLAAFADERGAAVAVREDPKHGRLDAVTFFTADDINRQRRGWLLYPLPEEGEEG